MLLSETQRPPIFNAIEAKGPTETLLQRESKAAVPRSFHIAYSTVSGRNSVVCMLLEVGCATQMVSAIVGMSEQMVDQP
ncbi:hypothetical protein [Bradyrhizobium sp. BR13661]|uniref:hypothetical protein n=1 Tax=Bradyrhizobium sp. BR13661 TaxID=2940622 RepID=UPI002472F927|nr:hypothetical protein [Bradyrhizobium sp. BR13661]MDH6262558.1 hypothetical protein [Bradyrhizobium sp. BR13661]